MSRRTSVRLRLLRRRPALNRGSEMLGENVQAWLTPQGRRLEELDALLDDKAPAYYAHKLAA